MNKLKGECLITGKKREKGGFLSFIRMSREAEIISDGDGSSGGLVKAVTDVQLGVFWKRFQSVGKVIPWFPFYLDAFATLHLGTLSQWLLFGRDGLFFFFSLMEKLKNH